MPENRRLFLCDGDALIMPQERLKDILLAIRENLPAVARVSTYANAKSLSRKSPEELAELAALGLRTLFTHAAMPRGLFLANHASNYLPLKLRMPRDREPALRLLGQALAGQVGLRPEWSRGL